MNQQQDSQGSSSQFEDDEEHSTFTSPWQIQGKGRTHEGPKSEHPSTYDESIPPLSYRAQDREQAPSSPKAEGSIGVRGSTGGGTGARVRTSIRSEGSARSGASATRTDKYAGGRQVPSWARPQQNNSGTVWFYVLLAIIGILLLPVLYFILQLLFVVFIIVITVLIALLLAFVIIATLWFIGKLEDIKPPFWW